MRNKYKDIPTRQALDNNIYIQEDDEENIFITGSFQDKETNFTVPYVARFTLDYNLTHWVRYFYLNTSVIPKAIVPARELELGTPPIFI